MPIDTMGIGFFPDRLIPLGKLTNWNEKLFFRSHSLLEKYKSPSPLMPTIGAEVEVMEDRFNSGKLPFTAIAKVEDVGIPFDTQDTFHSAGYGSLAGKWEAALQKSTVPILLAREIEQLRRKKVLNLKRERVYHPNEYYPVHVTLGDIIPDFPNFHINVLENGKKQKKDWLEWRFEYPPYKDLPEDYNKNVDVNVLMSSDSFLLARIMEATGWATSKGRLEEAFDEDGNEYQFMRKGTSGVCGRGKSILTDNQHCVEFRTVEIWGEEGMIGLQKYMDTIQALGAMLSAYQKFPPILRDKILQYEYSGKDTKPMLELLREYYPSLQMGKEQFELATNWISFREDVRGLFELHELPNPMHEYGQQDFQELAKAIPLKNRVKKSDTITSMARDLVISHRAQVKKIIKE